MKLQWTNSKITRLLRRLLVGGCVLMALSARADGSIDISWDDDEYSTTDGDTVYTSVTESIGVHSYQNKVETKKT